MKRIFDVHIHYPAEGLLGLPFSKEKRNHRAELEKLVSACEKNHIVKACLLGGTGEVNRWVLEAYRAYPELFIPMAYLSLDRDLPEAVDNYYDMGFKGFKIIAAEKNYDSEDYFRFYDKIQSKNMVALFHTGVLGGISDYLLKDPRQVTEEEKAFEQVLASFGTSSARQRSIYLDTIGMNFPALKVIGAHLGYGEYDISCAVARWRRNVYFDISGGDVVRRHLIERGYIKKEISPNKLLFGSDCTIDRMGGEIESWYGELDSIGLSQEEIDRIMYSNAAYLFE